MTKLPSKVAKNDECNLRTNLRVRGPRSLRQLKPTDYSGPFKHDNVLFNRLPLGVQLQIRLSQYGPSNPCSNLVTSGRLHDVCMITVRHDGGCITMMPFEHKVPTAHRQRGRVLQNCELVADRCRAYSFLLLSIDLPCAQHTC